MGAEIVRRSGGVSLELNVFIGRVIDYAEAQIEVERS
jgi:hypothetical protein